MGTKRDAIFKIINHLGIAKLCRFYKKDKLTILSLHRVSEDFDYFFDPLKPAKFELLVKYALQHYSVLSFSDLSDVKTSLKKPPLLFSFDDGYRDFYEHALPILKKYDLPSNHNVVNECVNNGTSIWTQRLNNIFNHCRSRGAVLQFIAENLEVSIRDFDQDWMKFYMRVFTTLLGKPKKERTEVILKKENELSLPTKSSMMNWGEIVDCTKNKVEIGSHTYSHDVISNICDIEMLTFEIIKSKSEIENKINQPVSILALPNGQGNKFVNDFIQRAGYKYLLYVNDALNCHPNEIGEKFHVFERINIVNEGYHEMVLRTELFHSMVRKYV